MNIEKSKILNGLRFYATVGKKDSITVQLDVEFPQDSSYASTYTLLIDTYRKESFKVSWTSESFPIEEMRSKVSSDQNEIIARNKKEIFKALEAFHHHCLTHDHVLKEISKVGLAEIDNGWRGLEIQLVEEVVGPVLGQSYILNISLSGRNVFYQKWKRIVRFPLNTMMAALKDASEQVVRENAELIVKVLKELLERLSLAEDETSEVLAPIGK